MFKPTNRIFETACLLFALIAICGVFSLPQYLHSKKGLEDAAIIHIDEPFYLARLKRAIDQEKSICSPNTVERKNIRCVMPTLASRFMGLGARVLSLSSDQVLILSRFIFPLIFCLLFILALKQMQLESHMIGIILLLSFLEPGSWYFKPYFSFITQISGMLFNRFANPLFSLIVFFLTFWATVKAFLGTKNQTQWAIAAGIFLGINFYITFFYWSHLCLAIFLWLVLYRTKENLKLFGLIVLFSAIVSSLYWYSFFSYAGDPVFKIFSWRNAVAIKSNGFFLIKSPFIYPYLILTFYYLKKGDLYQRFAAIFSLSGFLLYFSTLITQLEFQNFHWKYTLIPMTVILFVFAIQDTFKFLQTKFEKLNLNLVGRALFVVTLLLSVVSAHKSAIEQYEKFPQINGGKYQELVSWVESNIPKDQVIWSNYTLSREILYKTGHRIWDESSVDLTPNREILNRNYLSWKLRELSNEKLYKEINLPPSIANWDLGVPETLLKGWENDLPVIEDPIRQKIIRTILSELSSLSREEVLRRVKNFKIDILIDEYNEIRPENWNSLVKIQKIATINDISIYSFERRNDN